MDRISKKGITELLERIEGIEVSLDIPSKKEILTSLEEQSAKEDLWKDQKNAQEVLMQISDIKEEIEKISNLKKEAQALLSIFDESSEEEQNSLVEDFEKLKTEISQFESLKFLSGKYDKNSAILSIHSGQGGTEANDWAEMLLRMYTMYFDKKGWTYNISHIVKGNEVGISTVSVNVNGKYAYGMLKREHGTHRLVRLSPFNSQNLRQTSFAGVEVIPILQDLEKDIEIPESDIDFKAVRAGGPGGQNVNKTSSAVQITHIPTGITVHSSEERSQLQNRENAMRILKGKLWAILEENRLKEISDIKGEHKIAGWGNQIRNYILHPYKLVKDLRTNQESSNPESVLDGNLDEFLEAQLRIQ
ncbi:MAG: peptide chain release factor 2, peptide chain release factor 2 [candidate division WS6 bacterium GW2011_GWE2_33_157]|uniref:Peptide chain release factor 2 n=1 Tax=candidate division WS6 bacterium GW2011_GWB1_33_6 TaxID=1619088 RepID=A0A0G0AE95_9BACT|nr:MAG: peptide chain release factor 2, peptide chain release factor 2 [candidate division WS6 bacterium GW2011_GWE2_33_157]KKP44366.1 MAG: peptide chain release factor 2, peptide chain release factor 2 [candidate division WS6 bacterium GW2011_GWF1_33_233]KKP54851.1 MAG: peptide chain release factor 2, peptide chain release factor 2 [candidate division WS6 bacterium GW2011_WS6_33_547]KKP54963.1 MAG: Peptide chain release factor 2 [candidate division WS6 bacterium GW2011_GWB1_33_6]KKP56564.1 MAG